MDRVEALLEMEAIRRLKYRYMRCIDLKLWDELEGCFTKDATSSYGGGKYSYQGRDAILEFLKGSMGGDSFHSAHHVHHPEIELTGEDTARGVWALQDTVIETKLGFTLRGAAFYTDRYVKADGEWKIEHTGYERIYEEMQPRKDTGAKLTDSRWGASEAG
jgi:hypothetical protein